MTGPAVAFYAEMGLVTTVNGSQAVTPLAAACGGCGCLVALSPAALAAHTARDRAVRGGVERADRLAAALERLVKVVE